MVINSNYSEASIILKYQKIGEEAFTRTLAPGYGDGFPGYMALPLSAMYSYIEITNEEDTTIMDLADEVFTEVSPVIDITYPEPSSVTSLAWDTGEEEYIRVEYNSQVSQYHVHVLAEPTDVDPSSISVSISMEDPEAQEFIQSIAVSSSSVSDDKLDIDYVITISGVSFNGYGSITATSGEISDTVEFVIQYD